MLNANGNQPKVNYADFFQTERTAWFVLVITLAATIFAWYIVDSNIERRAIERFEFEVNDASHLITSRLSTYEQVLRSGVSVFKSFQGTIDREKWKAFVSGLELQTYFPGIQGVGYSVVIKPEDLLLHQNKIRAEGFKDYSVYPAGEREIYTAIVYLEPFNWRNQRAFGYDMFSEPNRNAAMSRARDTGLSSVTKRVTLVQETDEDIQAGFLMYLPHYDVDKPVRTEGERRDALLGYVYSAFRMNDFMTGILLTDQPDLEFEIYDKNEQGANPELIYTTKRDPDLSEHHNALFQTTKIIELFGHAWQINYFSTGLYEHRVESKQPLYIIIGGVFVDTLLFLIILFLARQKQKHSQQIKQITNHLQSKTNTLRLAQESAGLGVWEYDVNTGVLNWDKRMYDLYQREKTKDELVYEDWLDHIYEEDKKRAVESVKSALTGGTSFDTSFRLTMPDGNHKFIRAHAITVRDEFGKPVKMIGVNYDITKEKSNEERLQLLAKVYEEAVVGIIITDKKHKIIEINRKFTFKSGFTLNQVKGATPWQLFIEYDKDELNNIYEALYENHEWKGEMVFIKKSGERFDALLSVAAVYNESGDIHNYVYAFNDISEIKEQQRELEKSAHYDPLTSLPNRVLLKERLKVGLANAVRNNTLLAVCFFDLDNFKPINDDYGHDLGDELLMNIASRIQTLLRESDSVSRLGGDEFILLLSNIESKSDCEEAIQRIKKILDAPYVLSDARIVDITISIGISIFPHDNSDADLLMKHADQAMYDAKKMGGNCYKFYDVEKKSN